MLNNYSDEELLEELENRGLSETSLEEIFDCPDDLRTILSVIDEANPKIGSELFFVRSNLHEFLRR